tara:strand:- start:437 stop:751 length:315 start_codon:yes stop_codon:yes gene_type:complete
MTINSNTDINLALLQLGKNANRYRLDQNCTPHKIIEWDSANTDSQPTDDELNSAYTAWDKANGHKSKRVLEYPTIEDQLDDIYHNGIDGWKATIKTIKDKYPKS